MKQDPMKDFLTLVAFIYFSCLILHKLFLWIKSIFKKLIEWRQKRMDDTIEKAKKKCAELNEGTTDKDKIQVLEDTDNKFKAAKGSVIAGYGKFVSIKTKRVYYCKPKISYEILTDAKFQMLSGYVIIFPSLRKYEEYKSMAK